jgi:hypothetical protein
MMTPTTVSLADDHQQGVRGQGPRDGGDRGQEYPERRRLSVLRAEVDPDERCEQLEHARRI